MDIWQWVRDTRNELRQQGHNRLADLLYKLSSSSHNEEYAQHNAVVTEALALARSIKNPWLEVFIRHWNLQNQAIDRYEITEMLPEALDLLAFAHRDDTRDCPQSICVIQDVAVCYGLADGPSYVEERLTVAKETLDRIDATWPCFTCISSEYADALADAKRYEEALNFLKQQTQALLLINQYENRFDMTGIWVKVLAGLQRYEEAYAFNQEAQNQYRSKNRQLGQMIDEACLLAYLKRYKEAQDKLPDFATISPTPGHYSDWANVARLLVEAGIILNDWHLNAQFQQMSDKLSHQGVIRLAFIMTLWQAELALKRDRPNTAKRCYDKAKALIPRLRKPLDAPQQLENLHAQIASALTKQSIAPFDYENPAQVLENLEDDPESAIDLLENARQRWPEHEDIAIAITRAYEAIGEFQYSRDILKQHLEKQPNSPSAVLVYGFLLFDEGQYEELQNFAFFQLERDLVQSVHLNCHWLLALQFDKNNEFEPAKQHLSTLIEQEPNAINARTLLAQLERKTGHLEAALSHLDWVVAQKEESGNYDWDRMVVATLLGDWDKVRHSAERLEFKYLPKTNPIDEEWELCRIQFTEPNGEHFTYFARRTSPVTARIIDIASPNDTQHFLDTLVFEPTRLNKESEEEQEYAIYAAIQVTHSGGYNSYTLDGVHPGKEAVEQLQETLGELECYCQIQSGEAYQLYVGKEELLGLYAYIAIPETQSLQFIADLLADITKNYTHPLTWLDLVEKLENKEEIERQQRIVEEYEL